MKLHHKVMRADGREIYLYYPCEDHRTPFKTSSITVLLDKCDEKIAEEHLDKWGLRKLAEANEVVISFIVPTEGGWNYKLDPNRVDDVAAFPILQEAMVKPDDEPLAVNDLGIPLPETMISVWHPMHDTRYVIGVGTGASMALTLGAVLPNNIAAILVEGGELCGEALSKAVNSAVPVCFVNPDEKAVEYFKKANEVDTTEEHPGGTVSFKAANPLQSVTVVKTSTEINEGLVNAVWNNIFFKTRRPKTGAYGNVEPRMNIAEAGFDYYIKDTRLPDGKEHTWFVHVPTSVKADPTKKVPVMFFYHGGSDNPHEAAEMSRFHVTGEKEGYITVYPWGTDTAMWNNSMNPDMHDDVKFCRDLIDFMIENYPVDPSRIYLSGFSNGAGMAQTMAMLYPDVIAAICHIDANWPGRREGITHLKYEDVTPMALALEKKKEYDYRMPIWYTYGTREVSFPIFRYSTQQNQYDFWKMYNNIEIKETPEIDDPEPSGCGVIGDVRERIDSFGRHKELWYDVQRFFTKDEKPENYYNMAMMHDKEHDIAELDSVLGWNYVKQFRRNPDGSVGKVEE